MFRKSAFLSMIFCHKKPFRRIGPDIIGIIDDILCKLIAVNQGILSLFIFLSALCPKSFGQQDDERCQEQKGKQERIVGADVYNDK